jgi:MFS family permease
VNRTTLTIWLGWLAVMAGANLAAPLYSVYATRFGFSSLVLTLIFATYAVTLVPALIVFGRLSDRLGRRPVLLAGFAAASAGLLLFALATNVAWLFAARALQGLAVGMISGTATAALVEADSGGSAQRPALLAGLAQTVGSGLGALVAGVLAQWGPDPLQTSFIALLVTSAVAAGATGFLPEPARAGREPWRIQWPRVPQQIRSDFARLSLTGAVVWSALALQLSIVPSYTAELLRTNDLALLGAVGALTLGASSVALVISQRLSNSERTLQAVGLVALAGGLAALATAGLLHSLAVLLVGALATGCGHGLAFLNTQHELNEMAPRERRGEVTAAFVSCIYGGVGVAVIATGVIGVGASLTVAVGVVAALVACVALATATWQAGYATRPAGAISSYSDR